MGKRDSNKKTYDKESNMKDSGNRFEAKQNNYDGKQKAHRNRKGGYSSNKRVKNGFPDGKKQDPFWYAKDQQSIDDFAKLPFVDVAGEPIDSVFTGEDEYITAPGMLIADYYPTMPGAEVDRESSFATRAADAFYQNIAQGFSANFDFEAPDLLMLEVAAAGLFAFMAEGPRALGCMHYYLQNNTYWAESVVRGLGWDFDDLKRRLKDFVAEYNIRVEQVNKQVALPTDFFIGARWRYLSANLFKECETTDYSVVFGYKMGKVPAYNGFLLPTGTCLEWITPGRGTVDAYFETLDKLIAYLTGDDQRQMFGAIRRVYSDGELVKLQTITTDHVTSIELNKVQAVQLHNTVFFQGTANLIGTNVLAPAQMDDLEHVNICAFQSATGSILANYFGRANWESSGSSRTKCLSVDNHLISMLDLEPTSGNCLDITNDIPGIDDYTFTRSKDDIVLDRYQRIIPRTEIICDPKMIIGDKTVPLYTFIDTTDQRSIVPLSRMERGPMLYVCDGTADDVQRLKYFIGNLDRYTVVTDEYLRNLHNKCAFQLLSLPSNSKSITK